MLSIDVNYKCIYCTDFSNETIFAFLVVDISIPPQGVMTMLMLMLLAIDQEFSAHCTVFMKSLHRIGAWDLYVGAVVYS